MAISSPAVEDTTHGARDVLVNVRGLDLRLDEFEPSVTPSARLRRITPPVVIGTLSGPGYG